jgi:diguanylate cyclase (GGDEF)-like protein
MKAAMRIRYCSLLLFWLAALAWASPTWATSAWTSPLWLFGPAAANADTELLVYEQVDPPQWPADLSQVNAWTAQQQRLRGVDMQGGHFWLRVDFRPRQAVRNWVVQPGNTFFERAQVRVYGPEGEQSGEIGIGRPSPFVMHSAVPVRLRADTDYVVLVSMEATVFTSQPRVDIYTADDFERRVRNETLLCAIALGALLALGIFNLLIGLWTRSNSYWIYGTQSLCLAAGWAFYFGLPYRWFGFDIPALNFAPFFVILTGLHAAFCSSFLELPARHATLARFARAICWVSAVSLPFIFVFPHSAHVVATLLVGIAIGFAVVSGVWALLHDVTQARFMLLGYLAILLPGLLILPANLGLMPDVVDNADLLVLVGNAVESMLLALALADRVKSIESSRERFRVGMQAAMRQASTDSLTSLGNRYAFNLRLEELLAAGTSALAKGIVLAVADLDGLKVVNDREGHARGDALISAIAKGLSGIDISGLEAYRLGGDEFALLILSGNEFVMQRLNHEFQRVEADVRAQGFPQAGISFGIASAEQSLPSAKNLLDLLDLADQRMYGHKAVRRVASTS